MSLVNAPPTTAISSIAGGQLTPPSEGWRAWFNAVYNVTNALTMSGTTAQRPVKMLWVGRTFFDQTLGIPIWLESVTPTVWIDATGTPV